MYDNSSIHDFAAAAAAAGCCPQKARVSSISIDGLHSIRHRCSSPSPIIFDLLGFGLRRATNPKFRETHTTETTFCFYCTTPPSPLYTRVYSPSINCRMGARKATKKQQQGDGSSTTRRVHICHARRGADCSRRLECRTPCEASLSSRSDSLLSSTIHILPRSHRVECRVVCNRVASSTCVVQVELLKTV